MKLPRPIAGSISLRLRASQRWRAFIAARNRGGSAAAHGGEPLAHRARL